MPKRLRPTAAIAPDAILVGDPGRALLLAQELLEQPKMSNHARGLWGYSGESKRDRRALTIQSTGIGGPSAALVLGELAELGVRRAVRVGTCAGQASAAELGALLGVGEARALGGSAVTYGAGQGEAVRPDAGLSARLSEALAGCGGIPNAEIASFDAQPEETATEAGAIAADMQTAPLLARARELQLEVAVLLIVAESFDGEQLGPEALAESEKRAGRIAAAVLSP